MAVSRMQKVLISGYAGELESFMKNLQMASILHVREIEEIIPEENKNQNPQALPSLIKELKDAKAFLDSIKEKPGFFESLTIAPKEISTDRYEHIVLTEKPEIIIEKTGEIQKKITDLNDEKASLKKEMKELEFWKAVDIRLPHSEADDETHFFTGLLLNKNLNDLSTFKIAEIEILAEDEKKSAILAACHRSGSDDFKLLLEASGFEEPPILLNERETFSSRFSKNKARLKAIEKETRKAENDALSLLNYYDRLEILLEYETNLGIRNMVFDSLQRTRRSFLLGGWIKQADRKKLDKITAHFDSIEIFDIPPERGDSPPVELTNPRPFSPFELITRLYSTPSYRSVDPSSSLALFFAVFFGITLTDAGYGIILSLLAVFLLKKTSINKSILKIMFLGGIFTMLAGILTGGIFGDLFRADNAFVDMPLLISIRENLMWFDPMKDPMVFFRLVLFLGTVHILTGMFIGLYSNLKNREYMSALTQNTFWILILVSLLYLLFSSELCVKTGLVSGGIPPFSGDLSQAAVILTALSSAGIILFSARDEKSLFFRIFIGFLKLVVLSGIFSYLGDILSYIRLMALGMVTAGIAMAVNTIVFMTADIPYAGYFIALIIFITGHTFNLAINILGGFVHTLRLQYVEFFSKFFIGGGVEFKPLSYSGKYTRITD